MTPEEPPTWADTITRAVAEQARAVPVVRETVGHALAVVVEDVRARWVARSTEVVEAVAEASRGAEMLG